MKESCSSYRLWTQCLLLLTAKKRRGSTRGTTRWHRWGRGRAWSSGWTERRRCSACTSGGNSEKLLYKHKRWQLCFMPPGTIQKGTICSDLLYNSESRSCKRIVFCSEWCRMVLCIHLSWDFTRNWIYIFITVCNKCTILAWWFKKYFCTKRVNLA